MSSRRAIDGGAWRPKTRLVVVQPTPFCNIDCRYCYLPRRSARDVIDDATLENLFRKLWRSGWARGRLDVVWHAGEPTVLPLDFYRRAFAIADRHRPTGTEVFHSFQTNATLLDEGWVDFIRSHRVSVGISIDGPRHLNDRNRVTRSGRGTFDKALAGMRLLRERDIPFQVITVLSAAGMASARELHDFYAAEGDHMSSLDSEGDACASYRDFLTEFWTIAAREGRIKSIREIDHMMGAVYLRGDAPSGNELVEPLALLNVDCHGDVSTFSPELLGQKNAHYGDFVVGNVNVDAFADIASGPKLARLDADIQAGVALCRAECGYFSLCGGGEPVNKLAENGTFVSSATTFCRLTRMTVADLVSVGPHAV